MLDSRRRRAALNTNQQNVANALINFFNTTGGIPIVFGALTPAGLSQVSGETATGSQQTTFNAMNLFMGVMTDPFIAGRGDLSARRQRMRTLRRMLAYAAQGKRAPERTRRLCRDLTKAPVMVPSRSAGACGRPAYGGSQTTDGNATVGSNNTPSRIYGTAVGADYRFSPYTLAGFALAGGGTNFSVAMNLAPAAPTCFRPARSSGTMSVRPICPARWPMAGRTSPPIAP